MSDDNVQILIEMSQVDYDKSLAIIDRVMRLREEARKKRKPSGVGKSQYRKQPPELIIISNENDILTISITKKDHEELKKMFHSIEVIRKAGRKCYKNKVHATKQRKDKIPVIPDIK